MTYVLAVNVLQVHNSDCICMSLQSLANTGNCELVTSVMDSDPGVFFVRSDPE
jgi:hypothetical protein